MLGACVLVAALGLTGCDHSTNGQVPPPGTELENYQSKE